MPEPPVEEPVVGVGGEGAGSRRRAAGAVATGLFLLVALAAVAIALRGDWAAWSGLEEETRGYVWDLSVLPLLAALAAGVTALLVSGVVWVWLFRAAGGRTGGAEAVAAWLGSNLGRYLPGKVWQLTSLAAWIRTRGDSGATALAVSLALQAAVLVAAAAVAAVTLGTRAFAGTDPRVVGAALAVAALALSPPVLRRAIRWGRRVLRERGEADIGGLDTARLMGAGLCALLLWTLYGLGFWALIHGLVSGGPVRLATATGIFAAGYLIGYLVLVAPGGIVVREGAIAALLGAAAGIPPGPATAIALAARLWTTVAELVAFGVAAGIGLRTRRRKG
ncbi:MAG: lysylphosphatidylglycerol synthase domain-containing protein [Gemmatimonadota bacterium]|nr:lysylphosphatidylglycerol synthase domain-containing protein [Gemmatimonadota bacterium]